MVLPGLHNKTCMFYPYIDSYFKTRICIIHIIQDFESIIHRQGNQTKPRDLYKICICTVLYMYIIYIYITGVYNNNIKNKFLSGFFLF